MKYHLSVDWIFYKRVLSIEVTSVGNKYLGSAVSIYVTDFCFINDKRKLRYLFEILSILIL